MGNKDHNTPDDTAESIGLPSSVSLRQPGSDRGRQVIRQRVAVLSRVAGYPLLGMGPRLGMQLKLSPYKGFVNGKNDDKVTTDECRGEKPPSETHKASPLDVEGWLTVCCSVDAKVLHFFSGG